MDFWGRTDFEAEILMSSNIEVQEWTISIGFVGPTDCTLLLTHSNGQSKEALIESSTWKILSELINYCDLSPIKIYKNTNASLVCKLLWQNWKGN
ncbi:hypothetical protein LCGC14_0593490 [marine sediment metagenome]|uniref:Uncharacterized protein n=1 Tax=marine sediment metagenome TaxID=412755 RepID=A0A0F9TZ26_9ZZZZ